MGDRQLVPFFRSGSRIVISKSGNLGRFSSKFHGHRIKNALFIGIFGVWGAKKRPTAASAAPTALRSQGSCPPALSGICKDFSLVSPWGLCISRPRQPSRIRGHGVPYDMKSPEH